MINIYLSEVNNVLLSQNKLKHIFWKSFEMNKYKINPLLIHVKEKEQTMRANYVVVLSMQNAHPYFKWNCLLRYRRIFLEKSDGNKAGKCRFLACFGEFKVQFCEIIDVWTLLIKRMCERTSLTVLRAWTLFIPLGCALDLGHEQSFMSSIPLMNS